MVSFKNNNNNTTQLKLEEMKKQVKLFLVAAFALTTVCTHAQEISEKILSNIKTEVNQIAEVANLSDEQKTKMVELKKNLFLAKEKNQKENATNQNAFEKTNKAIMKKYYGDQKNILTDEQQLILQAYWAERNKKAKQ